MKHPTWQDEAMYASRSSRIAHNACPLLASAWLLEATLLDNAWQLKLSSKHQKRGAGTQVKEWSMCRACAFLAEPHYQDKGHWILEGVPEQAKDLNANMRHTLPNQSSPYNISNQPLNSAAKECGLAKQEQDLSFIMFWMAEASMVCHGLSWSVVVCHGLSWMLLLRVPSVPKPLHYRSHPKAR